MVFGWTRLERRSEALDRPAAPLGMTDALAQTAVFEYIGQARLVVRGEVTRRLYRFESFGAKVMVDLRDAPSCASVPWLVRA